jgi:recombination protein RecA
MSKDVHAFLASARGAAAAAVSAAPVRSLDELRTRRGGVEQPEGAVAPWGLAALRGRLVELSARGASATLSAAIELVLEAQAASEPVAWLTLDASTFYPPDVAACGVDLAALVVVRTPTLVIATRAAERVLRSSAFGLVVIDLGGPGGQGGDPVDAELPLAHQGRLVSLAQAHDAAVVCLTSKPTESASLGSLVSLRAEALRRREPAGADGNFTITVRALKDKRRGPGWTQAMRRRGPPGM